MSPGDEFEVVAADAEEGFYFHSLHDEKGAKVYAEGGARYVAVYRDGELLSCGHKRQEGTW